MSIFVFQFLHNYFEKTIIVPLQDSSITLKFHQLLTPYVDDFKNVFRYY